MPRRIPDYPDAYAGWNMVSSVGAAISLVGALLFLWIFGPLVDLPGPGSIFTGTGSKFCIHRWCQTWIWSHGKPLEGVLLELGNQNWKPELETRIGKPELA